MMDDSNLLSSKPDYVTIDGLTVPGAFSEAAVRYAINYQPEPGDVFIATYPKCGTTWVQYIVYLILNDGQPIPAGKLLYEEIPFIEWKGKDIEKIAPPRVLKTHLPTTHCNVDSKAKYIFVIRNPKDCCVSFYYHCLVYTKLYKFNGTFEDFFEYFINGKVDWNDYFDHLRSWWSHKDQKNVLFLVYEEMLEDPVSAVKRIAKFLEKTSVVDTEGMAEKIAAESAFDKMKQRDDNRPQPQLQMTSNFFRKGKNGDWRNCMSKEQAKRIDERQEAKIGGTEIDEFLKSLKKY